MKLLTGSLPLQIYLGRVELGKRLPASLSLSNDSDMGGGSWGGGVNNPLQCTNVEANIAIIAIHFRACLSLLIMKVRG